MTQLTIILDADMFSLCSLSYTPAKSAWASLAQKIQDLAILDKMFLRSWQDVTDVKKCTLHLDYNAKTFLRSWQDLTDVKKCIPHLDYNAKMSRSNVASWQSRVPL